MLRSLSLDPPPRKKKLKNVNPIDDTFLQTCARLEGQAIVIELKNNTWYVGGLWQFPDDASTDYSCQSISVVLQAQGHWNKVKGCVDWSFRYPNLPSSKKSMLERELTISRSEIASLRPDDETHTKNIWSQMNP